MGHYLDGKNTIVSLIDRLNKYPIGLFDNNKLRRILELLFTKEEAFVASRFPLEEATLPELCHQTGLAAESLLPILEQMANKGLIMDLPYNNRTYYLLMPGLIGFFEFTFMKQRADLPVEELARLMTEYLYDDPEQGQGKEFFGSKTPLTRSLTYEEHIPVSSVVTSYESAREIIRQAEFGAVGMCYCRHKKQHLHESCKKGAPVEGICISLGTAARFMTRRDFAEKRSTGELLAVIDRARDLHLTHITDNIRHKPSFICNCCSCCCELLGGIRQGFINGVAKAGFMAKIDHETCIGCGLCAKACNIAALQTEKISGTKKHSLAIREDMCLGCGACIGTCPTGSLTLTPVSRPQPPEKKKDLFIKILKEKKRFTPFLVSGLKKKVRRFFGAQ
jgi:NAD-dependent dihydropyrimidine dehydrogenase PreA subunit